MTVVQYKPHVGLGVGYVLQAEAKISEDVGHIVYVASWLTCSYLNSWVSRSAFVSDVKPPATDTRN